MDNNLSEGSRKRVLDKLADCVRNNRAMSNLRRYNVAVSIRIYPWITGYIVLKHMRGSKDTTEQVHGGIASSVDLKGGRPQGSMVKHKLTE